MDYEDYLKAKKFYEDKQIEHVKECGVEFDTCSKIAQTMEQYRQSRLEENDTLYEFTYCECIYESGPVTISLHRTRIGAENAMEEYKAEAYKKYEEIYPTKEDKEDFPFGEFEVWAVKEIKVED